MSYNTWVDGMELKYGDAAITCYRFRQEEHSRKVPETASTIHHVHTHYEIHMILKGAYDFVTAQGICPLNAGELLILPPGTEHDSVPIREDLEFQVLSVKLEPVSGQKGFYRYFSNALHTAALQPIKCSRELREAVRDWNTSPGRSVGDLCRQQAVLGQIVWLLFRDMNGFRMEGTAAQCSRSRSEVLAMLDNLVSYNHYTLADIAEAIDYSPRNVSRLIRNTYHMSLKELRVKYALDTAKKLLASENLSMDEVAVRSNFKSTAAMRAAFRKYLNTTPTDYKKQQEVIANEKPTDCH